MNYKKRNKVIDEIKYFVSQYIKKKGLPTNVESSYKLKS